MKGQTRNDAASGQRLYDIFRLFPGEGVEALLVLLHPLFEVALAILGRRRRLRVDRLRRGQKRRVEGRRGGGRRGGTRGFRRGDAAAGRGAGRRQPAGDVDVLIESGLIR